MFTWICIAAVAVVAAYFAYDWRRTSRLKRDLAGGVGHAPDAGGTPSPDARHGLDAHQHHARGVGDQGHGTGYV
ncbi:hypothetical protein [uncultured Nocardioides sp.]|uniref:hypothetical protein n=1 Tax=uncultured Nocardioides sp. TaxID=198441 RepID=UPI002612EE59|nr:hypothetical protein [uncultured Nocardioides sp.]